MSLYDHEKGFAERSLLRDLQAAGFLVASVWEWVNSANTPAGAVPILLEHFDRAEDEKLVEGIARAVTDKRFKAAVPHLVKKFPIVKNEHVRWAIANAIAFIGFGTQAQEVLELAADPSFGPSRGPLVDKLHRIKDARVEPALLAALDDLSVVARAASALAYCGTAAAIRPLEELLKSSSDKQVIKYAKRALEKIRGRTAP